MYTEHKIKELIRCKKKIIDSPKTVTVRGSTKKEFMMASLDNEYIFKGFMSQNDTFSENFSIGLIFDDKEERDRICLLRCNGKHGSTRDDSHHNNTHIHMVSSDDINNGIRIVRKIEMTEEYSTYEEAIHYFLELVQLNRADRMKYFPRPRGSEQLPLFPQS